MSHPLSTPTTHRASRFRRAAGHPLTALVVALGAALLPGLAAAATLEPGPGAETDKQDFSAAEKLLFMTPQLGRLKPPQTLNYSFRKAGSFEPGFDDKVAVQFTPQAGGGCCAAHGEFLSEGRRLVMPDIPEADANPVILYFLEHDVREMNRLTKGAQNHFRKMIRMAVYKSATVRDISVRWRGQQIKATEIGFSPFLDDPNRPKYEKFVGKEYRFVLSDAVPGGVFSIRTRVAGADDKAAPLLLEELYAEGAEPATTF